MKIVATAFWVMFAVVLCVSMTSLVAMDANMKKTGNDASMGQQSPKEERRESALLLAALRDTGVQDEGCFPATRALLGIAYENMRERFEGMTREQVALGVTAVIGLIGIIAFTDECVACNGNVFWFLNNIGLANLFYGANNQA